MRTFTVIQLEPSRWVKEDLLIDLTGMSTNEIKDYRQFRWIEGVHFKKSSGKSSDGGKGYKYDRVAIDEFSASERVA
ncbi:excisionase family protein [Vibrio alginolyticus]|nr:excisionase family protein [Vibrio alginolyticus]ELB1661648.1 excisionase family protein [Vibrio alginolyticus]